MKHTFIIALTIILCSGCSQSPDTSQDILTIPIDQNYKNVLHLDSVVASYTLIEIETNQENLIGRITLLEFVKDWFYISDRDNNTVFIIDQNGRIIDKLTSVGRGPDGFSDNTYIQVSSDKTLHVLSGFKGIVSFDSTGKYLGSLQFMTLSGFYSGAIMSFALNGTGSFYLWNGTAGINRYNYENTFHIYELSNKGEIAKSYLPIRHGFFGTQKTFYGREGNYLLQSLNGNDTIYRANSFGITPGYFIDFQQSRIPDRLLPDTFEDYLKAISQIQRETDYSAAINSPIETEKYLFFQFDNRNISRFAFYYFESGKLVTGTFPFRKLLGYPTFSCCADNKLVGFIDPSKTLILPPDFVDGLSTMEKEIYQKILKVNPSNNPVLLLLDLKEL